MGELDAMSIPHVERIFRRSRVLLPVVHPISEQAALDNTAIAVDAGCPGVFLINQGMSIDRVFDLVLTVRRTHPDFWIGVNLLGISPADALREALAACHGRLDGLWSDDAMIDEGQGDQRSAQAFLDFRSERRWQGSYFGGVAFKYQRAVQSGRLADAARAAAPYMDVICSSGPGTGMAADPGKLVRLREGLGDRGSMALASGVTEDNIGAYLPYVDAFLVGTGIERRFGVLDAGKVSRLQRRIGSWSAPSA